MEQAAKTKKPWSGKTKVIVTIVSVLLAVALIGALGFVIVFGYLPLHGYDEANDYGFTDSVNSVLDACGIALPEDARFEYSVTHEALRGYSSDIYFTVPRGGADANADGSIDAMAEVVYKTLKLDKKQYPRVREATEVGPSAASEKHEERSVHGFPAVFRLPIRIFRIMPISISISGTVSFMCGYRQIRSDIKSESEFNHGTGSKNRKSAARERNSCQNGGVRTCVGGGFTDGARGFVPVSRDVPRYRQQVLAAQGQLFAACG